MKLIFITSLFILPFLASAQHVCGTLQQTTANPNARMQDPIPNWADFVPNNNSLTKTLRINFHFILRDNGTGNFTESSDGFGNPYNGYMYVKDLVSNIEHVINDRT